MNGRFLGRAQELAELEAHYRAGESRLVTLYGRRRVGKTHMVLHFKGQRPGIYFRGQPSPASLQIREFVRTASRCLNESLAGLISTWDWKTVLSTAIAAWHGPDKLLVILDDFHWLVEEDPAFLPAFKHLWETVWHPAGKVMVILVSAYGIPVERKIESHLDPRGRLGLTLEPFPFWEAAEFHPHLPREEQAKLHFITGGVPGYLTAFKYRSLDQNICEALLTDGVGLAHEAELLIRDRLQGINPCLVVLEQLAAGRKSVDALAEAAGDTRSIIYQLRVLCDLGYVERVLPLTPWQRPPRYVRFDLRDAFLRFYYRFIFPNQSSLLADPEQGYKQYISSELEAYFGRCFERFCREALARLYTAEAVGSGFTIGDYWDQDMRLEIVGRRNEKWIDLGTCVWGPCPSAQELADELDNHVRLYPNKGNAMLGRLIFTKKALKVPKDQTAARFFCLEDLYNWAAVRRNEGTPVA